MPGARTNTQVLVLGAGLSGLMAATVLTEAGIDVAVVDKGRSVGGRLATRRIGPGRADHGAQFFSVRSAEFQTWADRWLADGLIFVWSYGWGEGSHSAAQPDGHPRYAVHGGMNQLAKHLADNLTARGVAIHTGEQVTAIETTGARWQLHAQSGSIYAADQLIATAPVPQTLALLQVGKTALPAAAEAALRQIAYAPCLCLLIWVTTDVALPEPGARQTPNATVTWVADNQRKGISPAAKIITVHAGPDFSRAHDDEPDETVREVLWREVAEHFGPAPSIQEMQVKRWRYALPTHLHPARYLAVDEPASLYFGGDAFGGPRVEGAALSGLAVGQALAQRLS